MKNTKNNFQKSDVTDERKISFIAGVLYLITFISIPTLTLYSGIHQPNYLLEHGNDSSVIVGGLLEIIVAIANIGTGIVLYPILKKQNKVQALGFTSFRILEASTMFLGVAFLLTVVTLKVEGVGSAYLPMSHTLVALYDRTFLLGQGFIPGINDLLLGLLFYKSRLVPRTLSVIGIVGAVPLFAGFLAIMFGLIERISPLAGLSAILVAIFEFSLGIWLIIKGFNSTTKVQTVPNEIVQFGRD